MYMYKYFKNKEKSKYKALMRSKVKTINTNRKILCSIKHTMQIRNNHQSDQKKKHVIFCVV